MTATVSIERLRELLDYDPASGTFTWRKSRQGTLAGPARGTVSRGYLAIGVERRRYLAHRLAWAISYGEWPPGEIDHIDRDRLNNRLGNLRIATRVQNNANTAVRRDSKTGIKGVQWHPRAGRWRALIKKAGKRIHLGFFDTTEEASAAYAEAAHEIHGEFACSGFEAKDMREGVYRDD